MKKLTLGELFYLKKGKDLYNIFAIHNSDKCSKIGVVSRNSSTDNLVFMATDIFVGKLFNRRDFEVISSLLAKLENE